MNAGTGRLLPAIAALVVNAFIWGVSWWPFRRLDAQGFSALWTTATMYLVAAVVLAAVRPGAPRALLRDRALWGLMLASGATNAAFNWGVTVGNVVQVVLLFYLMPVWTALLARVMLGERIGAAVLVRMVLALAGALIVLWPAHGGLPLPEQPADWLGLAGGFFFALNNVLLRRHAGAPPELRALSMFVGGAIVAGSLAVLLAATGHAPWPASPTPSLTVGLALMALAFVVANLCLQFGMTRLPANLAAVIMPVEIVFASGSAALAGGEPLTPRVVLGGTLIVLATLLAAWRPRGAATTG